MARQYTKRQKESTIDFNVSGLKLDISGLKKLKQLMKNLPSVDVGYLNGEKHPKWDFSFAELAVINNYGVRGDSKNAPGWAIPPRPMMEGTFNLNKGFAAQLQIAVEKSFAGNSQVAANQAFKALGVHAADKLNLFVKVAGSDGYLRKNAPMTIAAKGKDDPLNWTGALAKAAKFRLVRKTSIKP